MPRGIPNRKPAAPVEDDDDPITQRRISAGSTAAPATTGHASVFALAKSNKPARAPRQVLDPLAVQIKSGVPLPERRQANSTYAELWQRMKPGDMVELPIRNANGLIAHAKKLGAKAAIRRLGGGVSGVWRLE